MDRNEELLERRLQDVYRVEPPESLRGRLLAIADAVDRSAAPQSVVARSRHSTRTRWHSRWLGRFAPAAPQWRLAVPACAVAAAVAVLWIAGVRTSPESVPVAAVELTEQQHEAIADFVTVMKYLNASTALAHRSVHNELGSGLMTAFERGEQSFRDSSNRVTNGG
jgi:anti-sigma-K factor RskA